MLVYCCSNKCKEFIECNKHLMTQNKQVIPRPCVQFDRCQVENQSFVVVSDIPDRKQCMYWSFQNVFALDLGHIQRSILSERGYKLM